MKAKLRRCAIVALIILVMVMLGLHMSRQLNFSEYAQTFVRNSASNAAIQNAPRGRYPVLRVRDALGYINQMEFRKTLRDKGSDYFADSPYVFVIFDRGYRYEMRAITSADGRSTGQWVVGKWYIREWNNITPQEDRGGDRASPMALYWLDEETNRKAIEFITNFRSKTLVPDYIGRD